MGNGIFIHPADLMFDYRSISGRFNRKRDKLIGFCCSLSAHICMLTIAGIDFIKPVQFAVDQGLSGMEVQLVAGTQEATSASPEIVNDSPVAPEDPPIIEEKEIIPQEVVQEPKPIETQEKETEKLPSENLVKNLNLGNSSINASSFGQGAITEAQPFYLRNPAPSYPLKARQNGWEGMVLLKIFVDKKGHPVKVKIEKGSGHEVLDEAAFRTVKTWKFHPAQLGNIPIESSVRVPVRFKLDKFFHGLNPGNLK